MTKECKKCKVVKPLDDFYKHRGTLDGHLGFCKECKKQESSERLKDKKLDPEWLEKERQRSREKYYRLERKKTSSENMKIYKDRYKKLYPEKKRAKTASSNIFCPSGSQRHHWSYNEGHFKDVIILEKKIHYFLHRFIDYNQKEKMYVTSIKIGTFEKNELLDSKEKHLEFLKIIQEELW